MSACSGWPSRCGSRASTRVPPSGRAVTARSPPTESACSCMPRRPRCSGLTSSLGVDPSPVVEHPQQVLARLLPQLDPDLRRAGVLDDVRQCLADDPHQHPADERRGLARHLDVDLDRGRPGAERRPGRSRAAPPRRPHLWSAADPAPPAVAAAGRCPPAPTRRGRRGRRPAPVAATAPASAAGSAAGGSAPPSPARCRRGSPRRSAAARPPGPRAGAAAGPAGGRPGAASPRGPRRPRAGPTAPSRAPSGPRSPGR